MIKFIQPYQFNFIKRQALTLLQTHQSVNDSATIKTMQGLAIEKILVEFPNATADEVVLLEKIMLVKKSMKEVTGFLDELRAFVIEFVPPTDAQLKKTFAKTKKLKLPKWDNLNLKEYTFYGWNDAGKQRKYMIYAESEKWLGVEGAISPTIKKGICSVCHQTSEVALFTAKVKESGDGTYLNRGNYICHDSDKCNQQIEELTELTRFLKLVKRRK